MGIFDGLKVYDQVGALILSRLYNIIKNTECSVVIQETGFQSQVKSYQRLKKWFSSGPGDWGPKNGT